MSPTRRSSLFTGATAAVAALALGAPPALAAHPEREIVLRGASGTEGVASGAGSTFYAGSLGDGAVLRGDIRKGTAAPFVPARPGRMSVGIRADVARGLLLVAGGGTGQGYVYDLATGAEVASYQLADLASGASFVNDVAVTDAGAWFTDSSRAVLYFVPISAGGLPAATAQTLPLSGPAADLSGAFNNNGIQATANGAMLLVAHSTLGVVNIVDPATGASRTIDGDPLPSVDGILLEGQTLWAVLNFSNQVVQLRLAGDLRSFIVTKTLTSTTWNVPTTVARFGDQLALANSHFDTGVPATVNHFEVIVIDR